MSNLNRPSDFQGSPPVSPRTPRSGAGGDFGARATAVILIALFVFGGDFWVVRRIVVSSDEVMVLLKKDGSRSLPEDEFIIPTPPDQKTNPDAYRAWEKTYGDCNGIMEQVYLPGVYFGFSPWDYERTVIKLD